MDYPYFEYKVLKPDRYAILKSCAEYWPCGLFLYRLAQPDRQTIEMHEYVDGTNYSH